MEQNMPSIILALENGKTQVIVYPNPRNIHENGKAAAAKVCSYPESTIEPLLLSPEIEEIVNDMIKKYEEVMEEYNALVYAAAERFNKENQ